uniref:ATP synthase F0 subunit 8 n=1 Tax=Isoteinon lamprospilus TaxID=218737 RepID=UPI0010C3BF19|nr:ATP synthase F0 subunit 8 [Isoteinon lamprospilus]QBS14456.1 ATP synthase F0 subunit 8 [Isoteinon lamprospilus]
MPQMMPINWIISFILFILLFILFNMMNYYIFKLKNPTSKNFPFKKKHIMWKW